MTGKDYKDWGGYPVSGQTYPLKDLAEHAVRLGSPVVLDRSGAVVWIDQFEHGLKDVDIGHGGAGALDPYLSNAAYVSGGVSCAFNPGLTAEDYSWLAHDMPHLPPGLWGITCRWAVNSLQGRLQLSLDYITEAGSDWYVLNLNVGEGLVKLWIEGDIWRVLGPLPKPQVDTACFNFAKLVVDVVNRRFVRAKVNASEWTDLTDKPADSGWSGYEYTRYGVSAVSDGAGQGLFYLDDLYQTYNESE